MGGTDRGCCWSGVQEVVMRLGMIRCDAGR